MPTHYFLGQRLLGSSRQLPLWDEARIVQNNQAFICPRCGEVWGRVTVDGIEPEWLPVRRGCSRHPWSDTVGGSFIAPWRQTFAELPPEVLAHELNIRLAQLEKEQKL